MKQPKEEGAVEGLELVHPLGLPHHRQTVSEVVRVVVEKALFLDEVDEYQPVEHQGRVPLQVRVGLDAIGQFEEGCTLGLEPVVEFLGYLADIKGGAGTSGDVDDRDSFLFVKADGDLVEPLNERVAGLADAEVVVAAGQGLAGLAADPLSDLLTGGLVGINHDRLADGFGDPLINVEARGALGNLRADVDNKPPFLDDGGQVDSGAANGDIKLGLVIVPTEVFTKERFEVE